MNWWECCRVSHDWLPNDEDLTPDIASRRAEDVRRINCNVLHYGIRYITGALD